MPKPKIRIPLAKKVEMKLLKKRNQQERKNLEGVGTGIELTGVIDHGRSEHPPSTKTFLNKMRGEQTHKRAGDTEEMVHYRSGAKRVEKGIPPTHLVCPQGEIRVALICAEGLDRHGMIVDEAEFTTGDKGLPKFNLIKHIQNHWNKWRAGDRSEDHLAKIKWGLQKLMHKESQDPKLVADESQPWITACTHAKDMVSDEFRDELE